LSLPHQASLHIECSYKWLAFSCNQEAFTLPSKPTGFQALVKDKFFPPLIKKTIDNEKSRSTITKWGYDSLQTKGAAD
jgi:hypothetical protein